MILNINNENESSNEPQYLQNKFYFDFSEITVNIIKNDGIVSNKYYKPRLVKEIKKKTHYYLFSSTIPFGRVINKIWRIKKKRYKRIQTYMVNHQ